MARPATTVVECILVAADSLAREKPTFSAEDLVVRAWKLFPDRFGLQGYAEMYPDSNRVLTKIMGASGRLRKNGLIERTAQKRYRLTDAGRAEAARVSLGSRTADIHDQPDSGSARLAGLDRPLVGVLRRLRDSRAFGKFRRGESLSFSDVAGLLNISARSTANQLNVRMAEAHAALDAAGHELRGGSAVLPGTSETIRQGDIELLEDLLRAAVAQFSQELAVIRSRTDERYL